MITRTKTEGQIGTLIPVAIVPRHKVKVILLNGSWMTQKNKKKMTNDRTFRYMSIVVSTLTCFNVRAI